MNISLHILELGHAVR